LVQSDIQAIPFGVTQALLVTNKQRGRDHQFDFEASDGPYSEIGTETATNSLATPWRCEDVSFDRSIDWLSLLLINYWLIPRQKLMRGLDE